MRFMNMYEVDDAVDRYRNHPTLGPATETLRNLVNFTNNVSDGWAYWPKPARAAAKLMELIEGDRFSDRFTDREDVTAAQVRKTYTPIKAFLTRHADKLKPGVLVGDIIVNPVDPNEEVAGLQQLQRRFS